MPLLLETSLNLYCFVITCHARDFFNHSSIRPTECAGWRMAARPSTLAGMMCCFFWPTCTRAVQPGCFRLAWPQRRRLESCSHRRKLLESLAVIEPRVMTWRPALERALGMLCAAMLVRCDSPFACSRCRSSSACSAPSQLRYHQWLPSGPRSFKKRAL